jgi:hypothetical protein
MKKIILLFCVFGTYISYAQLKVGNNPTIINSRSNVEIEATNGIKMAVVKDSGNVGIGTVTPNINAQLEISSTNKGLLLPRVALSATNNASPLSAHVIGMVVYNTATAGSGSTAVSPGFYTNDGAKWARMVTSTGFVPVVVAAASMFGGYFYDDGAGPQKCRLATANTNDGNFNTTTFEYTVASTGTYNLALTMGYFLNNNNANNVHSLFATHANSSGAIIKRVLINQIQNVSYAGAQSGNVYMSGSAVFRPSVGDKLYFEATPCNGCAGRYTITSLEGTFQKISD